jgi:hypothetical protein
MGSGTATAPTRLALAIEDYAQPQSQATDPVKNGGRPDQQRVGVAGRTGSEQGRFVREERSHVPFEGRPLRRGLGRCQWRIRAHRLTTGRGKVAVDHGDEFVDIERFGHSFSGSFGYQQS